MKSFDSRATHILVVFVTLAGIFLAVSFFAGETFDQQKVDFAAYWQAGHMILSGQDVYDSQVWVAERYRLGTAFHSEPTFQYPLPFAILVAPFAYLSVKSGFILWVFLGQLAILASILTLLNFYPGATGYLELIAIAGIFLFRPTFIVISNGQIMPFLLLFVTLAILLFRQGKWFWGGLILSLLSLKPSIALSIFVLVGFWLVSKKRWAAILGLISGGIALLLLGMAYNPHWVADYLSIGQQSFTKYYAMQTTLWGLAGLFFKNKTWGTGMGALLALMALGIEGWYLSGKRFGDRPFVAVATLLPAALLTAPYSWSYDQILLAIPIVYILINISHHFGDLKSALFMAGIVITTVFLVVLAYALGHDVWSLLISGIIWGGTLFFALRPMVPEKELTTL